LRKRARVGWIVLALVLLPALWVLKIEVTYAHNVRHIPAAWRWQRHAPTRLWRA
jgi:hypothetical protein